MTPQGERISVEFLLDEPSFQPHHMTFIKNLGVIGIEANLRMVDPVQFRKRVDDFDFDLVVQRFSFSSTPGDSLRSYFSSQAAAVKGSQNLAGIADPVIDALIEKIIAADNRPSLVTACKVLDRVIRSGPLLDSALVQGIALARVSGTCSAGPRQNRAMRAASRRPGGTIATRRPSSSSEARANMTAYLIRRLLLMIPTLFGIMLVSFVVVQFAPGGPVERVIAQLSGSDTGATTRISGSQGGDFGNRGRPGRRRGVDAMNSKYRGAQGLPIRSSSPAWRSSSASTSRLMSASS